MNGTMVSVYGSLRRGLPLHGHLRGAEHVGDGYAPGLALYDLGAYPAAEPVPYEASRVRCEVYRVSAATLARLDEVEGVDRGFYVRRECAVLLDDGQKALAQAYLFRPGQARRYGAPLVVSGDWARYARERVLAEEAL